MLIGAVVLVLQMIAGFFTMLLLVRAFMRYMRISFIGQFGQFVLVTTSWAVRPFQRLLPIVAAIDFASLVPAWLIQSALAISIALLSNLPFGSPLALLAGGCIVGALELLSSALMLVMGVVILGAVLSWVNPHAPITPMLNQLTRPLLRPIQRILPPVSGIDLSPLVLLLVIQVVLFVLQRLSAEFRPILFS
ncbi:MAG: YggT family protein [Uliginosibacterium sp.]|nr:YggT family protein [Uliginosibacterium sp.]